jgi:hypothetical protein
MQKIINEIGQLALNTNNYLNRAEKKNFKLCHILKAKIAPQIEGVEKEYNTLVLDAQADYCEFDEQGEIMMEFNDMGQKVPKANPEFKKEWKAFTKEIVLKKWNIEPYTFNGDLAILTDEEVFLFGEVLGINEEIKKRFE